MSSWGGARKGSGRKAKPSTVVRIPADMKTNLTAFIENNGYELPHFDVKIPMGSAQELAAYADSTFKIADMASGASCTITCKGDSMEPTIREGAILFIDKSMEPRNNHIVAVTIDGESTLKRFKKMDGKIWLEPDNKKYTNIELKKDSVISIEGVATGFYMELV